MVALSYQFQRNPMPAKTAGSLSLLGPGQHIQYPLDLDTSGEIIYQQTLGFDDY
jgi:hypothetical protein